MVSSYFTWAIAATSLGIFLGMLVLMEIGRRVGRRRQAFDPEGSRTGVGAVEGAIFALLGLLLALSFSGAASRFDSRRQLIVEEANSIGTAYLRLDMLSPERRAVLRELFREYVDARLDAYRQFPDEAMVCKGLAQAEAKQKEIWSGAVAATREEVYQSAAMLLLPAINEMIDITTTRSMAARTHPPTIIFIMLGALLLIGALLAGIAMASGKNRSWVHILGFAVVSALTLYVILDLEYPRLGAIQLDAFDQALIQVRQSMK
jgi:CDP-diglyceride synthetase